MTSQLARRIPTFRVIHDTIVCYFSRAVEDFVCRDLLSKLTADRPSRIIAATPGKLAPLILLSFSCSDPKLTVARQRTHGGKYRAQKRTG
jgi:hypothetical protein